MFDSVVTSTLLYGCGSWTMTKEREGQLRSAQRRMLRAILGSGRKRFPNNNDEGEAELESWVEWVKRTTVEAESLYKEFGGMDWVREQRRRKWQWAGRIARRTDEKWTRRVLDWEPWGVRKRGSPCARWTDVIRKFSEDSFGENLPTDYWNFLAQNRATLHLSEQEFLDYCQR